MKPCILPWINFGTNTFGRVRVCGYSDFKAHWKQIFIDRGYSGITSLQDLKGSNSDIKLSDDISEKEKIRFQKEVESWVYKLENSNISTEWNGIYFRELRNTFLKDQWPANCNRCKYVEESGGTSKRMNENHMWYEKYQHLIFETEEDGSVNYQPPHVDVRTGTVCNSKCIHCGPGASSKWQEDKSLFGKYPNVMEMDIDNAWIAQSNKFWDDLDIGQIKKYNFLGGESFANKRHNEFIQKLSQSQYAKDVELQYVTNGSLITKEKMLELNNFKKIRLRLSIDALGKAGEYFRYPLNWKLWCETCEMINDFIDNNDNFDVSFQWTCSNVSMFYFVDTHKFITKNFPNIRFLYENHVTDPKHMSAQNLPIQLKKTITENIEKYGLTQWNSPEKDFQFYVNHMLKEDLWDEYGNVFLNYLDDIDIARNVSWTDSFSEMDLESYDFRNDDLD